MVFISVLTPALQCKSSDLEAIQELCSQTFGNEVELFQLVPITEKSLIQDQEIVVKLNQSEFSMNQIEQLILQNENLTIQLERSREALKIYQQELDSYKYLAEQDKNKKLKQLDEDNKKLRSLLKQQFENSENLRIETQTTVETLREEFNTLVRELVNFKGSGFKHEFPLKVDSREEERHEKSQRREVQDAQQTSVQNQSKSRIPKLHMSSLNK